MTIHSIIPIEDIFSIYQLSPQDQVQIVELNGIKAEVRLVEDNIFEIQRILQRICRTIYDRSYNLG